MKICRRRKRVIRHRGQTTAVDVNDATWMPPADLEDSLPKALEQIIIGLDHIQLAMPKGGEEVAEEFYSKILGFTRVPKPELSAKRGGCWFTTGVVKVHLG